MRKKHYHVMNGSIGCIPDNNQVCYTIRESLEFAKMLFSDIEEHFITELRKYWYYDFRNHVKAGADYIEIVGPCYDVECLQ